MIFQTKILFKYTLLIKQILIHQSLQFPSLQVIINIFKHLWTGYDLSQFLSIFCHPFQARFLGRALQHVHKLEAASADTLIAIIYVDWKAPDAEVTCIPLCLDWRVRGVNLTTALWLLGLV